MCLQTPMGWLRKQKYIEIQRQHVKIQVCGLGTSVEEGTRCRVKMHGPETERAGRGCRRPCSWHWPFWDENSTSLISVTWVVRLTLQCQREWVWGCEVRRDEVREIFPRDRGKWTATLITYKQRALWFQGHGSHCQVYLFFLSINVQLQECRQSTANSFIWWQLTVL